MTFFKLLRRRNRALTRVEALVIVFVLLVMVSMLFDAMTPKKKRHPRIKCVNNLKNIGLAFALYASENDCKYPTEISTDSILNVKHPQASNAYWFYQVLFNQLSDPKIVYCPTDRKRKESTNFARLTNRNVSYFIGLNAREGLSGSFLAGDRNIVTQTGEAKPGLLILSTNEAVGWSKSMHIETGNIAMGDGSVQQLTSARLAERVKKSGMSEFLLSIP